MARLDTLGRLTKSNDRPDDVDISITPRPAEVEMLRFINIHGAVNTNYLHAANSYSHMKSTQAGLLRLWNGGYIFKPRQQRTADNNNAAISVYELDKRGLYFLETQGIFVEPKNRSNWWEHDYLCSIITSSIHLAAEAAGWEFIPRSTILGLKGADIATEVQGHKLIPDDLFALKSPDGYFTAYTVEAYRSTEPATSTNAKRKTYERVIQQYAEFIGEKGYKEHYGLNARLLNLNVFNTKTHEEKYLSEIERLVGPCSYMLTRNVPNFEWGWRPPKEVWADLFTDPWKRVGKEAFYLSK